MKYCTFFFVLVQLKPPMGAASQSVCEEHYSVVRGKNIKQTYGHKHFNDLNAEPDANRVLQKLVWCFSVGSWSIEKLNGPSLHFMQRFKQT